MLKSFVASAFVAAIAASSWAFDLSTHRTILLDALYRGHLTVAGQILSFNLDVVTSIDSENGALDRGSLIAADPVWHVDNERISDSNKRILDLRKEIISKLADNNPSLASARGLLGRALHTLTDFYAHTNWVELGNHSRSVEFGTSEIHTPLASPADVTCEADGATVKAAGLTKLTSGYYAGVGDCSVPSGKCRHGGPAQCPKGLAKDPATAPNHAEAVRLATAAVARFVEEILNEVATRGYPAAALKFTRNL
jgi:hypothetical protein